MSNKYRRILVYSISAYFLIIAFFAYIGINSNSKYFITALLVGFSVLVLMWLPKKKSNYVEFASSAIRISLVNVETKGVGDEIALFIGTKVILFGLHKDQDVTSLIEQAARNLSTQLGQEINYYNFRASSDSWDWHQLAPELKTEHTENYLTEINNTVFTKIK